MTREPDPALIRAHLRADEILCFRRLAQDFGMEPDDWPSVPALELIARYAAVSRAAADIRETDPTIKEGESIRRGFELVGGVDDQTRECHPGDTYSRRLRDWRARGQIVREP